MNQHTVRVAVKSLETTKYTGNFAAMTGASGGRYDADYNGTNSDSNSDGDADDEEVDEEDTVETKRKRMKS